MSSEVLFLMQICVFILLVLLGFMLGRKKSVKLAQNEHLHSQPNQYGWFVAIYSALPAVLLAVFVAFLYLFDIEILSSFMLICSSFMLGLISLAYILYSLKPQTKARVLVESFVKFLLLFAAFISVLTTFGILISILFEALHFFKLQSFWYFIFGTQWFPEGEPPRFGALPLFLGTFYITFIAMVVAFPIGVFSAIFLSEYASERVRQIFKPVLEVLAGIPTVVYGFYAAISVAPFLVSFFEFFGFNVSFQNALAPGIVMGIMIIPIIASLSDDVISSVPKHIRQGSLALGMTKAETIKFVVLPSAFPGIIAATLLGVSRALGETMIVVMAAGLQANLSFNPLETMTTVTVRIVDAMTGDQAFGSAETLSAFALGLVLFVVTLVINIFSVMTIRKFHKKYKVSNL